MASEEKKEDNKEQKVRYATFNNRLYASAIDTILLLLVISPLFPGTMTQGPIPPEVNQMIMDMQSGLMTAQEFQQKFAQYMISSGAAAKMASSMIVQTIIMALIFILFWMFRSATPGKMLFRMKIVDAKTLGKPKTWQLIVRYLGYFISLLPLGLGFFWIGIDKRKQGWHDKLAGTTVIHTNPEDTEAQKKRKFLIQSIIFIAILLLAVIFMAIKK